MTTRPAFDDPRMRGFGSRTTVDAVWKIIANQVGRLEPETVDLRSASGRVLADSIQAQVAVPSFDRAAMDGYALRGEETFGSDPYTPTPFRLIGRVRPGCSEALSVGPGEAAEIATGAPMPAGADTVVRVEVTRTDASMVWVTEPTPPGRHVGRVGEDIAVGTVVLPAGRVLRPQDLGVMSSIGVDPVAVTRSPRVVIIVTGDELLPAGSEPAGTRITDANSPMLAALVERDGGVASVVGPVADDRETLAAIIRQALEIADALLISGGTSTGPEDHAPSLIEQMGELLVHGVAVRPSSPTGLGFVARKPVLLLPGNPVSCLCAYDLFGGAIVRKLGGRPATWPYRSVERPMGQKLASVVGRVDYARVMIEAGKVIPLAVSGASILSSATRAIGFVIVPSDLEGYPIGAVVTVWLYDSIGFD